MLQFYKTLVRPKLEYCIQARRLYPKKDINVLERVQRRATRMITSCSKLNYEDRLASLGLTTLETGRLRGDLIEVFKINKGYDNIGSEIFFSKNASNLRGHSMKVIKKGFRLDVGKLSFSNRAVNECNGLSEEIIQSKSLAGFKKID